MDRLAAMQTFVRVVESGSFSAVARETRSTQSGVSKQVAALERELGAKLLSRTTRSLALTEVGERYFAQARRLVAEIAEAEAERNSSRELVIAGAILHDIGRIIALIEFTQLSMQFTVRFIRQGFQITAREARRRVFRVQGFRIHPRHTHAITRTRHH